MATRTQKANEMYEFSIKVEYDNFQINDCQEDIILETGDLLKNEKGQYDIVIANILAHIIEEMINDSYDKLNAGGHFIASGIIVEKRDDIVNKMTEAGFKIDDILEDGGWLSILAEKV